MNDIPANDHGLTTEMQRLRHAHELSLPARSMVDRVITHPVFVGMCLIALGVLSAGMVIFVLWGRG